jgi:malonyl CoA-acyl carrier protein transacylase
LYYLPYKIQLNAQNKPAVLNMEVSYIMTRVAVEDALNDVKQALQNEGLEVVGMNNANECACCVISGQDKNVMGMAEAQTQASVINAEGMTTNDVVNQVKSRIGQTS